MNTLAEVVCAVRSRPRWVVTSHARPDGDAVGSVLGCVQILRAMGKQADAFLGDGVPFLYRGLPGAAELRTGPVDAAHYDGALILECDNLERTGLQGLEGLFSINIDHHETGAEYADVNFVVPTAAAAAELVYHLAQTAAVAITPAIATCLYTAVLTDTGSFCFSSTSAQTFAFAREMVLAGADPAAIAQQVYFSNPASKMHLLGRALATLQCEGPISWMHVSAGRHGRQRRHRRGLRGPGQLGAQHPRHRGHRLLPRNPRLPDTGSACAARDASTWPASPRPSAAADTSAPADTPSPAPSNPPASKCWPRFAAPSN